MISCGKTTAGPMASRKVNRIGTLPIVGLTGFVLARTTPCLQALDNKLKKPCVELLEQDHCRYGKETCKFTETKLDLNLVDLSFDYTRSPWLHYTSPGSQLSVCVESKAKDGVCLSHISEPRRRPLLSSPTKDLFTSGGLFQRLLSSPLVLSISNPLSNATPSPSPSLLMSSLQPRPALAMAAAGHQNLANVRPKHELRSGFTTPYVPHPSKTSSCSTTSIGDEHQGESALSRQCVTKLQSQFASSVFTSTKRRRRQRKARNCIRSKARKEAQERAGRLMRTLKHKDAQDSSPNAYISPDDATSQCFQGSNAQCFQGSNVHGGQFSPSNMALRLTCLTSAAVRSQSWITSLVPDGFKALISMQCQSILS